MAQAIRFKLIVTSKNFSRKQKCWIVKTDRRKSSASADRVRICLRP